MGSVSSNLTRITGAELADDAQWEDIGGGGGNTNSDEIFIQGSESQGRRIDAAERGFSFDNVSTIDLSAASTLVGWWLFVTQIAQIGAAATQVLEVRVGDNNAATTSWDGWDVLDPTNYADDDRWIKVWVSINEITPDNGSGTPSYAALRQFGVNVEMGNVGGTSPNVWCDAIDYLDGGGAALVLTGTSSVEADFLSADAGTSANRYGVTTQKGGKIFQRLRTQCGTSGTSVQYDDSNFSVTFPRQANPSGAALIESDANGRTFDLQNASTTVAAADATFESESATVTPGDLVVVGTAGTLAFTRMGLNKLRVVTLTSACTLSACQINGSGEVDMGDGATVTDSTIANSSVAADAPALLWDVNSDIDGNIDGCSFVKGTTANHAIGFGSSAAATHTLRNCDFSGYNASNAQNDSTLYFEDTGSDRSWTINLVNCTGNVSYKVARSGDTVSLVADPVTTTITALDANDGTPIQNARVFLRASSGAGDLPYQESVTITSTGTTATVSHTAHGLATGDFAWIVGANEEDYNGVWEVTRIDANSYSYTMNNSTTSPATGTIVATGAIFNTLTDVNGQVTDSRTISADQPVVGWVRKSSSSPYYKTALINNQSISQTAGLSYPASMVSDE